MARPTSPLPTYYATTLACTHWEPLSFEDIEDQSNPNGRMSKLFTKQPAWTWPDGPYAGKIPRIYHGDTRGWILNQILIRTDPMHKTIGQLSASSLQVFGVFLFRLLVGDGQ